MDIVDDDEDHYDYSADVESVEIDSNRNNGKKQSNGDEMEVAQENCARRQTTNVCYNSSSRRVDMTHKARSSDTRARDVEVVSTERSLGFQSGLRSLSLSV